ncbi:ATP-grasp fold amidoligase family protein [Parabacteroides sp.]
MKYIVRKYCKEILRSIGSFCGKHYPKQWISFRYYLRFRKRIDWKNPRNLNEKILYLSLMTDTTCWSDLTDKYRVREYIESCGFKDNLVELYAVWENALDINFENLPQAFVLKTNHGSGEIKIVLNKDTLDKGEIAVYFNKAIAKPYGEIEAGKHYARIKPYIIAEQLLINDPLSREYSKSVIDYKMWCFNGKMHYTWVCCNRDVHGAEVLLYDREWQEHLEYSVFTKHYRQGQPIPKPINYQDMIRMAEALARPFSCVRVDLYNVGGKIYFGELTFTSLGGMMNYFTEDFLDKAGEFIDLNYG